jgi:hypothetical protein
VSQVLGKIAARYRERLESELRSEVSRDVANVKGSDAPVRFSSPMCLFRGLANPLAAFPWLTDEPRGRRRPRPSTASQTAGPEPLDTQEFAVSLLTNSLSPTPGPVVTDVQGARQCGPPAPGLDSEARPSDFRGAGVVDLAISIRAVAIIRISPKGAVLRFGRIL